MNGYDLTRMWYNFKFENPKLVRAIHSDMYFYIVDLWNRLGNKSEFGLPTSVTMECLGIGSYNTYKKTFNDLVSFGFIKVVKDSINQHSSRIVALSKIDKATDKALDKATIKATDKATDTINKQQTTNKETTNNTFNQFWDMYGVKKGLKVCEDKWNKLTDTQKELAIKAIPPYVASLSDKKYQKHPQTYINQQVWLDYSKELEPVKTKADFTNYQEWLQYCVKNNINPQA